MEDTGETLCAPRRRQMSNVYPDIEHINSMTYDKGSGLKGWCAATFDFILDSLCEGATLVDITKPLERSYR